MSERYSFIHRRSVGCYSICRLIVKSHLWQSHVPPPRCVGTLMRWFTVGHYYPGLANCKPQRSSNIHVLLPSIMDQSKQSTQGEERVVGFLTFSIPLQSREQCAFTEGSHQRPFVKILCFKDFHPPMMLMPPVLITNYMPPPVAFGFLR